MIMTETMIVRVSGYRLCQLVAIVVINMIISRIDVMVKSIWVDIAATDAIRGLWDSLENRFDL